VGLDGTFAPPQNNCGGPAPDVSLWGLLAMVLVALGFLIFRRRGANRGSEIAV